MIPTNSACDLQQSHKDLIGMAHRMGLIRSGGRTERIRKAVVDAALGLLRNGDLELPYQRLSELSGVHQSTIYRRWPNRYVLLQEIFSERMRNFHVEPREPISRYLVNVAKSYRDLVTDPLEIALGATLAASNDKEYNDFVIALWTDLSETLKMPLYEAISANELPEWTDPQLLITIILDTISAEVVFSKIIPTDSFLEAMIQQLLGHKI